ncbi:hypothetical protein TUM12370_18110 [Salmonella enterica subsp. enterica serovar Choleraesuis]|nr:hypothetical protein TUM12370_18110 [Salmonella enterica subsp. enterica serovar Choleraesuis]
MKNGLEVDAPFTKEISSASAWAIRAVAVMMFLYGISKLITAVVPLVEAFK